MTNQATDVTFSSLDPSQKSAFRAIIDDDVNLHIVHGPPGTGKSQLVVSLLEKLASENKKVLFVSQNTEALKVIERMIRRTEKSIGYPSDNKYVSLLDFCLMLYNPTHRHLKYLREQYTRISGKQLPAINNGSLPESVQYALQYVNLSHDDNYSVHDDVIGFDELVSYYLRYVNQVIAPEPIREFEKVDLRNIFNAIDNYAHQDYFAEFNHPRRELVLLSTKNADLSLPDVRGIVKNIKDNLSGNWMRLFPSKRTIDIIDYLALLKEYQIAITQLDAYKISTENINPAELAKKLKEYIASNEEYSEQIERIDNHTIEIKQKIIDSASGVTYQSKKIHVSQSTIAALENDFDEVLEDRKRIIETTKSLIEQYPNIVHTGIQDVWVGLAQAIGEIYRSVIIDEENVFGKLKADDIDRLNADIKEYNNKNVVKRKLGGIPNSFKDLLLFTNTIDLDMYQSEFQVLLTAISDILKINNDSIDSLLAIKNQNTNTELKRIGVKLPKNMQQAKDTFLPIYTLVLLLQKYSIDIEDFSVTKAQLTEFDASISALKVAINNPTNKKLYLKHTLESFIVTINNCIDIEINNQKRSEILILQKNLQNESYRQHGQYLANVLDAAQYTTRAKTIYEYLIHNELKLSALLKDIALPDNNVQFESDLNVIVNILNDANLSDYFSDYFFEVEKGQTLNDWVSVVTVLETYNNDAEIVDFIEHNNSINLIRDAMGVENKKYLDDVLSNDITFDVFAARIISVLISESFGRSRLTDKKRVTTKDIIDSYETYLKSQKAMAYRENLRNMYSNSFSGATKELSKQSTLQAAGKSTMDKFRYNTHIIASAFPIICATPKDVSKYIAASMGLFDYVIFDEASQLLPGQAIPSIYRAKKAVIIGDPHQMPPSVNASFGSIEQSDDDFDDLGESILDLVLKQPHRQHHLKVHYRSKYNKLFEPSRESIYSNDGIEPIFEAELASGAPIDIIDDLGDEYDEYGYDRNFYKICESIGEYIEMDKKADFCVLFTRSDIVAKFKDFLSELGERNFSSISELYNAEKILISTVTNCQGIEGAYTIIYMHHYSSPGAMWFFRESVGAYKRLNVSITRQRSGLKLLLADSRSHWLRVCDEKINHSNTGPNVHKSAELMKSLLTSAGEQADTTYLDRKLGQNANWFDSPLTEQLYNKLSSYYSDGIGNNLKIYSEVGWNLVIPTGEGIDANERNVGFRVDLGIYSIKHKKFVLGIEMDGAMYHSGYDKEHSDYNRQKILEDKGWHLYRIWSTNWLSDNEREFNKLTQIIDDKLSE